MDPRTTEDSRHGSVAARVAALVLLAFGILPVANWIPGGHGAPWYGARADEWFAGTGIVLGSTLVLLILGRRLPLWREGFSTALAARAHRHPIAMGGILGLVAALIYSWTAWSVLGAVPLHLDEVAQLYQARIFARGMVTEPLPLYPEFTSLLHLVDFQGRRFSQFPPGGPLMLVPGVLLGAPWLVGPLFGGGSVALFWGVLRRTQAPGIALGASVLFALSPFSVFMFASHMNHGPSMFWMLVALYALIRCSDTEAARPAFASLAGASLGMLGAIRPVDALAFALPAGVWLGVRALARRQLLELAAAGIALLVGVAALLWFNVRTTGDPFRFAYELQWGREHGLGFHAAPWGLAHSPARGVELISVYMLRLQTYLFETPVPSLAFPALALVLSRRLAAIDRYMLASGAFLLLLYFSYWHDGFYLGPRFVFLLVPVLALWSARLPSLVAARWPAAGWARRSTVYAGLTCLLVAGIVSVPSRAAQYGHGLYSMRLHAADLARQAGIRDAVILVRESWGSQLIARLWARGVSRAQTEALYRGVDACILEREVTRLEGGAITGSDAAAALRPLMADSARVVPSSVSPDRSERMLPGSTYTATCAARIDEDRAGFTLMAPLLVADAGSNLYFRDLHARDSVLLPVLQQRAIYVLRATSAEERSPLGLFPASLDSLLKTWNVGPRR